MKRLRVAERKLTQLCGAYIALFFQKDSSLKRIKPKVDIIEKNGYVFTKIEFKGSDLDIYFQTSHKGKDVLVEMSGGAWGIMGITPKSVLVPSGTTFEDLGNILPKEYKGVLKEVATYHARGYMDTLQYYSFGVWDSKPYLTDRGEWDFPNDAVLMFGDRDQIFKTHGSYPDPKKVLPLARKKMPYLFEKGKKYIIEVYGDGEGEIFEKDSRKPLATYTRVNKDGTSYWL